MNRLSYKDISPASFRALLGLETQLARSGLDRKLKELVCLRLSQINGCAYCVDMHDKELRAAGESNLRLSLLVVWRESPQFTARERTALAWAEAVNALGPHGVSDDVYNEALAEFGEAGLVDLTLAVVAINGWNRMNVAFRAVPGEYQPGKH